MISHAEDAIGIPVLLEAATITRAIASDYCTRRSGGGAAVHRHAVRHVLADLDRVIGRLEPIAESLGRRR